MDKLTPKAAVERFKKAKDRRAAWESHWQECYDYALPQRGDVIRMAQPGAKRTDKLFDGTAPDAVDQLAASLLAQLTPPWTRWFGFRPGVGYDDGERQAASAAMETVAATLQRHLDRSNFVVEMHQCYLDLVTAGTACLLVEDAPPGDGAAFRFTAVPLSQVVLEEGASGRLDTTFRRSEMTRAQIRDRFPSAALPDDPSRGAASADGAAGDGRIPVIEAVVPEGGRYTYLAVVETAAPGVEAHHVLARATFDTLPYVNFRWLKAPGEVYGRSPVMKALPDIKTVNKVVELILKNASISVTGIWQADDDGVLNPATIKLAPGTIIPKAVGSQGLTPLKSPGDMDMSQLILDPLRDRIRKALLADKLSEATGPKMTATEVLERSQEMARLLGATYGRLQSELLTPLLGRLVAILSRRGEIKSLSLDGWMADVDYRTPVGRYQSLAQAKSVLAWVEAATKLGPGATDVIDRSAMARWMADAFGVPSHLLVPEGAQTPQASPSTTGLETLLDGLADGDGAKALDTLARAAGGVLPVAAVEAADDAP